MDVMADTVEDIIIEIDTTKGMVTEDQEGTIGDMTIIVEIPVEIDHSN